MKDVWKVGLWLNILLVLSLCVLMMGCTLKINVGLGNTIHSELGTADLDTALVNKMKTEIKNEMDTEIKAKDIGQGNVNEIDSEIGTAKQTKTDQSVNIVPQKKRGPVTSTIIWVLDNIKRF